MKKEEQELLKFRIDQLRKSKMVLLLESIALTFIVELTYVLMVVLFGTRFSVLFALIALIITLAYFIFIVIKYIKRCSKIKTLEKRLYKK